MFDSLNRPYNVLIISLPYLKSHDPIVFVILIREIAFAIVMFLLSFAKYAYLAILITIHLFPTLLVNKMLKCLNVTFRHTYQVVFLVSTRCSEALHLTTATSRFQLTTLNRLTAVTIRFQFCS